MEAAGGAPSALRAWRQREETPFDWKCGAVDWRCASANVPGLPSEFSTVLQLSHDCVVYMETPYLQIPRLFGGSGSGGQSLPPARVFTLAGCVAFREGSEVPQSRCETSPGDRRGAERRIKKQQAVRAPLKIWRNGK
ncbi:hypothetical protein AAFF_G00040370 [Aldrovandia affinis]|uniref:Uncharacterized protein n=1 Tax=Aldrovandia affinis TaxID=143900 RepID=A0AAD7S2P9_9TELE|nr:hypothetical protein AAFF_G00040370 [Aldrovandia affinis]